MLPPEEQARQHIDAQLSAACWHVATPSSSISQNPTALCESSGQSRIHWPVHIGVYIFQRP